MHTQIEHNTDAIIYSLGIKETASEIYLPRNGAFRYKIFIGPNELLSDIRLISHTQDSTGLTEYRSYNKNSLLDKRIIGTSQSYEPALNDKMVEFCQTIVSQIADKEDHNVTLFERICFNQAKSILEQL